MVIASGSELLIFQKSEKFFEYLSVKKIFLLNTVLFSLRWILIAFFPDPKIMMISQLLHGITFGLFHVTTVNYISKIVGDSFEATGQNLYASTISIATVASSLTGGMVYDYLGGSNLFLLGSIISLLAGIGCYFNIFISPSAQQKQSIKSN